MMLWLLCFLVLSASASIPSDHPLHAVLHHFETLQSHHLKHTYVTSTDRTLMFSTLDRDFQLNLKPRQGLFSPGMEINSVGAGGKVSHHAIDISHFFMGHVEGEVGSKVTAHLNQEEGLLTASIHTPSEHYFIEPAHQHFKQSHDFHMISYRVSDLKQNSTQGRPCGTPPVSTLHLPPVVSLDDHRRRLRRQGRTLTRNSCPMLLVATGRFHQTYSRAQNVENTILFMVQVIDDVDQSIFRQVAWDEDISNFGLAIKNITVYEAIGEGPLFNSDRTDWSSGDMLRTFSHHDYSDFCLAHLFAFQQFTDNRVGVAYPASAADVPGGICTPALPNFNGGAISSTNVGLSSYNSGGRPLLLAEGRLITAHEIGHNWGSEHDPTDPIGVCNPEISNTAGKFLMFPSLTDGTQPNNDNFSLCSQFTVSEVLRAKSQGCFISLPETQCGNYAIEGTEACDAGLQGMLGRDPCCNASCQLREGTNCSDTNHVCCVNCHYAPSTELCRSFPAESAQCLADVFCDGRSETCPENSFVEVNTSCRAQGQCLPKGTSCDISGNCNLPPMSTGAVECYDFCRLHGMEQCFCSGSDECFFCCRPSLPDNGNCTVFLSPGRTMLPDSTSCVGGLCRGGQCVPLTQDLVNRLFDLFTDISIDKFFEFLSENIVGSVMTVTAIIWIVVGIPIHCYDRRRYKAYRRLVNNMKLDRLGNDQENVYDDACLDELGQATPQICTSEARHGLIRMGSRTEGRPAYDCTYSFEAGYIPEDRVLHGGQKLSSVLEHSTNKDPSSDNIMDYIITR